MNIIEQQLEDQGFTKDQIQEINEGLKDGLDVEPYAKKEFLSIQMHQIRLGLLDGLPVERYARPEYDWFRWNSGKVQRVTLKKVNNRIAVFANQ